MFNQGESMIKFIFMAIVVGICIASFFMWKLVTQLKNKKDFMNKFGFYGFPKYIKFYKRKDRERNYFDLSFPYWEFENKDGTRDKRRKGNRIYYPKSELNIQEFKLQFKNPLDLVECVKILREKGNYIEQNRYEREKEIFLQADKKKIARTESIDDMIQCFAEDSYGFEKYCTDLFRAMGINAITTSPVNDGGYDIILTYPDQKRGIVECKCYNKNHSVGRPQIQKLVGANQTVQVEYMIFITTSDFSAPAVKYANDIGVHLINGTQLMELSIQYLNAGDKNAYVSPQEWTLSKYDLQRFIPKDIYNTLL